MKKFVAIFLVCIMLFTTVFASSAQNELDKTKHLNAVGLDYLSDVIDSVVNSANLDFYIKIIKDHAIRRNLINTTNDIILDAYENEDVCCKK